MASATAPPTTAPAAPSAVASALSAASASGSRSNSNASRPRVPPLRTKCIPTFPSELRSPLVYGGGVTPRSSGVYSAGPNSALFNPFPFDGIYSNSAATTPVSASLKRHRDFDDDSHGDSTPGLSSKTPITPPAAYVDFLRSVTPITSPAYATHGAASLANKHPGAHKASHSISKVTYHPVAHHIIDPMTREENSAEKEDSNNDDEDDDEDDEDSMSDSDFSSDQSESSDEDDDRLDDTETELSQQTEPAASKVEEDVQMKESGPTIRTQIITMPAPAHMDSPTPQPTPTIRADPNTDMPSRPASRLSRRASIKDKKMEIHVPANSDFVWAFPNVSSRTPKTGASIVTSPMVGQHSRSQSTPAVTTPRAGSMTPTPSLVSGGQAGSIISPGLQSPPPHSKLRICTAASSAAAAAATAAAAGVTSPAFPHSGRNAISAISPHPSATFSHRSPLVSPKNGSGNHGLGVWAHPPTYNGSLPTSPTGGTNGRRSVCQVIQRTITTISRGHNVASPTTSSHPNTITEVKPTVDSQAQEDSDRGSGSKRRKMKE